MYHSTATRNARFKVIFEDTWISHLAVGLHVPVLTPCSSYFWDITLSACFPISPNCPMCAKNLFFLVPKLYTLDRCLKKIDYVNYYDIVNIRVDCKWFFKWVIVMWPRYFSVIWTLFIHMCTELSFALTFIWGHMTYFFSIKHKGFERNPTHWCMMRKHHHRSNF